ncbi:MarR family transcriptional regulator [Pullulanibacillus sp. KACC 23026]|uniref:MarR family winged helix-turn-helix transcriptional regulator n=1 Tax=Pullulanibacillus sp. KACC 23026 TaxID=3028315 RepID=UPI0023AF31DE|nr:MarR family transcriptional regulator [Pullulanibacillus sp. KACC 23026]WEG13274.1 MarR family transcriptional regulator [Pullulanibacillus sp. KACC 23026]
MNFSYKQDLVLMVRSLYFCMEEQWAELARIYDISPAQQHILFILTTNQKTLTPSEISEIGYWHTSTVSRLLKPLKDKGFITVNQDPKRNRYKQVTITPTGEEIFQKIIKTITTKDFFPFKMSFLTEQDLENFLKVGQKILDTNKGVSLRKKIFNAKIEGVNYT